MLDFDFIYSIDFILRAVILWNINAENGKGLFRGLVKNTQKIRYDPIRGFAVP